MIIEFLYNPTDTIIMFPATTAHQIDGAWCFLSKQNLNTYTALGFFVELP